MLAHKFDEQIFKIKETTTGQKKRFACRHDMAPIFKKSEDYSRRS